MTSAGAAVTVRFAVLMCGLSLGIPALGQNCDPRWDVDFGSHGMDGAVRDSVIFDDGSGPALYVCGAFTTVGNEPIGGIARWDGRQWSDVDGGLRKVGGFGWGSSMVVWDDGTGSALYVAGGFTIAGNNSAYNIARWDGREWSALGAGLDRPVYELCVFDDGRGAALYAGGGFEQSGGEHLRLIARWDGNEWEPLGGGLGGSTYYVASMTVFDDGSGSALYVGGDIYLPELPQVRFLARWNGSEWSGLDGVDLTGIQNGYIPYVEGLTTYDDGAGPALFIAGPVQQQGVGRYFLKWDGRAVTVPEGFYPTRGGCPLTMEVHDDGRGPALWLGGGEFAVNTYNNFTTIARWDGRDWSSPASYPSQWIETLAFFNDGFGEALYVGGVLTSLQGQRIGNITRWTKPHATLAHSPLRAGEPAQFATTCSTPGRRVYFTYSTTGLGSFYVPQLNVTLDLDRPRLAGFGVADQDGKAELIRTLPPNSSGRTLHLQAAEQWRKSEVVEAVIE